MIQQFYLNKKQYVVDILTKFGMTKSHVVPNPICLGSKMSKIDGHPLLFKAS